MQMGVYESSWVQTPFVPDEPAVDLRAVTINDDMSTMFPEPREFATEVVAEAEGFFSRPSTRFLLVGAVVLWLVFRK